MAEQMCLACSVNPAVPNDGSTVPLCASCKKNANNPRGVTVEPRTQQRTKKPRRAARR